MKTKHFATNFAAPVFFFMSVVFYLISALTVYVGIMLDANYLVLSLLSFLVAYNCWEFGKSSKQAE